MRRLLRRVKAPFLRIRRAWLAQRLAWARRGPIRGDTVLYESFSGNGALDNPEAVFRALLRAPDQQQLHHVWVLDRRVWRDPIRAEFRSHPRVRFVRYRSAGYQRLLAQAGYLVNNATFPPEFDKRPGQVYLNTWHGTPLKHMGYDMPNGGYHAANTLRNFMQADWLLSQNPFMSETMYARGYKLHGAFRGRIAEVGYPRVDRQRLDDDARAALLAALAGHGVVPAGRKVLLYAPTWKGTNFSDPEDDATAMFEAARELQRLLGDEWLVLLKVHQSAHRYAARRRELRGLLLPNALPTNALLGLADALVTDFSSIFFDFLATGRPILFHVPGLDEYEAARGLYFDIDALPGPAHRELAGLADELLGRSGGLAATAARRAEWQARFTPDDDGAASDRVVDLVFRRAGAGLQVLEPVTGERTPVLLYLGGMRSNGITTSVLNLLRSLDHDRYDVSVLLTHTRRGQAYANQQLIDPRVRQFRRIGGMNGGKLELLRYKLAIRYAGRRRNALHEAPSRLLADEWHRIFGDARFDAVVDFSGYSAFWTLLLLHAPESAVGGGPRHSIWLHNDMAAEVHRVIDGRERMRLSLPAVFSFYDRHAALVSVSPALAELNERRLVAEYDAPAGRFVAARNLVDVDRVLTGFEEPLLELRSFPRDAETGEIIEVPAWAQALAADDGCYWFVTVGRLSTEKNQARLIRAFAAVHAEHPRARLLIVGYGPLRERLEAQLRSAGLAEAAFLTGALMNPFAVLAAADCFVLSSDYEGQPMVLLEAALAGLPIVSVRFSSVGDALPPGAIHIVDQEDAALAEGMRAALEQRVPPASLDAAAYNRQVVGEFTAAVFGATAAPAAPRAAGGRRSRR